MKPNRIKYNILLLVITSMITTSCSNNKQGSSDIHIQTAEMHERTAKNYRDQGVDYMADYYNDEALSEREKVINSCDLYDITLSIITLGFLDCE